MVWNRLAQIRTDRGMTQEDVAQALGVTQQCYNQYENGKRDLKSDVLTKLRIIFKVSVDAMIIPEHEYHYLNLDDLPKEKD